MTRLQQIEAQIGKRPEEDWVDEEKHLNGGYFDQKSIVEWERKRADIEQARAERAESEVKELRQERALAIVIPLIEHIKDLQALDLWESFKAENRALLDDVIEKLELNREVNHEAQDY